MAIKFHPKPGQILLCDFSQGFKEPEMVKAGRPVVVLTKALVGRSGLVTVAALSTVKPNPVRSFHLEIPSKYLPMTKRFQNNSSWLKGDMIYTVGFHRLDLIRLGTRNRITRKREYFRKRLSPDQMKNVYACVLEGLGLSRLVKHV